MIWRRKSERGRERERERERRREGGEGGEGAGGGGGESGAVDELLFPTLQAQALRSSQQSDAVALAELRQTKAQLQEEVEALTTQCDTQARELQAAKSTVAQVGTVMAPVVARQACSPPAVRWKRIFMPGRPSCATRRPRPLCLPSKRSTRYPPTRGLNTWPPGLAVPGWWRWKP